MSIKRTLAHCFRCGLTLISPKLNTMVTYRVKFGKKLDLNHPQTLNENVLWLKFHTYWKNPLVKKCADKYRVREYVEQAGLGGILNELIAVYRRPEEINWSELPERFAIKLNVGCGYNHIVFDKSKEDFAELQKEIRGWLKAAPKYYLGYSEMQYKDVEPYILVEKFLGDDNGTVPDDYKFYCMNGVCKMIMYCRDRDYSGHGANYYFMDNQWNMLANTAGVSDISSKRPDCLTRAIQYAETLSKPFPFVRVDFYLLGDKVVFGELTFTPAAGMDEDHKLKINNKDVDLDHFGGNELQLPTAL